MMILLLYTAYFITGAMCYEGDQNVAYNLTNLNVTTLYPVKHIFNNSNNSNDIGNFEAKTDKAIKILSDNDDLRENNLNKKTSKELDKSVLDDDDDETATIEDEIENRTLSNNSKNENEKYKVPKLDMANWKIDTSFTPSNIDKPEDVVSKNKNDSNCRTQQTSGKEFKPSPQLGYFYSEDEFVVPTQATIGSFSPANNPTSFSSSPGDFYKLNYRPPFSHPDPIDPPYKFEKSALSRDKEWKYNSEIEPTPTVEAPGKIPAGGLYKLPDPFKEKPSSDGDDDSFGLDFNDEEKDGKENPVKKRGNPWKSLLHLMTALLPVGIILSALTPNIITLENTNYNYPSRYSRRSSDLATLPPISENCKRRLLCEIHSDTNYSLQSSRRQRHCYKIQCDDAQALSKVLQWLLLYNRSRGHRPAEHDRRGYINVKASTLI